MSVVSAAASIVATSFAVSEMIMDPKPMKIGFRAPSKLSHSSSSGSGTYPGSKEEDIVVPLLSLRPRMPSLPALRVVESEGLLEFSPGSALSAFSDASAVGGKTLPTTSIWYP